MTLPAIVPVRAHLDARGSLGVIEQSDMPFQVQRVYYLGHLTPESSDYAIYQRQCLSPGSMIAFDIVGGEAEAFRFLNALQIFRLAVSLGGTESLAEHPASMTHSDVDPEERIEMGIGDCMVRLSIGVEHPEDLIADLEQALGAV